jgi:hypothetical protein
MGGGKMRSLAFAIAAAMLASTGQSFAYVKLYNDDPVVPFLSVYGEITKDDADSVAQQTAAINSSVTVDLNSVGGSVDAAMKIGRIIRAGEATTLISPYEKCLSSCALIYIAGVARSNSGVIGLHRPFLGAALSREAIERAVPVMLQRVKDYVREMGISDAFYDAMVNTEVSEARLYRGNEIKILVPDTDPTYDEIQNSYLARQYGVSAQEMRRRRSEIKELCDPLYTNLSDKKSVHRYAMCLGAIYWGIDPATYERIHNFPDCQLTADEMNIFFETEAKKRRDLPFVIKQENCKIETVKRLAR